MAVEKKIKVLPKAEKEIYQNMSSNLRKIEEKSAEFREFAEIFHAWKFKDKSEKIGNQKESESRCNKDLLHILQSGECIHLMC